MRFPLPLIALLLAPSLALAQAPDNGAPGNGTAGNSAPGNGAAAAPNNNHPPASAPAANGEDPLRAQCHARMKEYLDSLACFEPYRHGPHVIDIEAFKHCKVVKEPTDCEAQGLR